MSSKFSPTLSIGDLNDYLAPSQACVVYPKGVKSKLAPPTEAKQERTSEKKQEKITPPVKPLDKTEVVKISLKDCLACSGCVTSAETVLLEKQNVDDFLSNIALGKAVIMSISSQSRASLAVHFGLSPSQVLRKLTTFFKSLGVKAVFDTSCSGDLSLVESCEEFLDRFSDHRSLPMIASSCPGWVIYAEKTLGSYILPYISSVKSPQQAIGAAIKHHVCRKMGFLPDQVYHVTVMPCYDKKLEAARDDFVFSVDSQEETGNKAVIAEVDTVLTSGEVMDLIQLKSVDLKALDESPLDRLLTNVDEEGHLYGVSGSSGGYADTIFRHAAKILFGRQIEGPLDFKVKRNPDFQEVILEVEGKVVLKFALCYGFKNLKNVERNVKSGKCDYHFLEIMACPSGCLNGGGQIKLKEGQSHKDLMQSLQTTHMEDVLVADPFENPIVKSLYDEWLEQPGSEKAKKHLHTEYHHLEKSVNLTF
ncbi:hypothetical protein GIB67_013395 [Kingdonia uniflora]|uniref:Iron hydrogenase small subunit domain-containing protein n=1 Tax=Kingdonia uniflora TaxID=39325 RepID=A0A7J7LRA2_9MAGN|nr:hypothetical protein GIB67_013395 [Kingdonia uniflora]